MLTQVQQPPAYPEPSSGARWPPSWSRARRLTARGVAILTRTVGRVRVPRLLPLPLPSLEPPPRTHRTARKVADLDRLAAWALWCCWWPINTTLWCAVSLVLLVERWQREVQASGWNVETNAFTCPWCASVTHENERYPLSCCRMAAREAAS
jgi:hypothetical protein